MPETKPRHQEDCKRKLSKPADLCECNSKWGGIKVLAIRCFDFVNESQESVEAELRRRVEPLLQKAEALAHSKPLTESATYADNLVELRKELLTWK